MAKILFIEDDADIADLVKTLLESDGHSVLHIANGEEALALIEGRCPATSRSKPDLILTDVMLPGVDGYSLAKAIGDSARLRGVPVIVLTARHDLRDVILSMRNVVDFIEKPFLPSDLRGAVNFHAE